MSHNSKNIPSSQEHARRLAWFEVYTARFANKPIGLPLRCPCCGCKTLDERGISDICEVCFWEDDGQDDDDADVVRGGPNGRLSLAQARANYFQVGACEQSMVKNVRAPRPEELPGEQALKSMIPTTTLQSAAHAQRWALGPVLLIGGSGMLGRAWRQLLAKQGIDCIAPSHGEFDLTDPATMDRFVTGEFSTVINCSAWTDVDGAEKNEQAAAALNATAVGHLAARCGRVNVTLVHYSTDYVFNGHGSAPYPVDAPIEPINVYGATKAMGERAVQQAGCRHLIIRTSWLYAPWGKNFVRTIAKACREKPSLKVVSDQRGRPTSSEHLADLTLRLLTTGATGTYHGCDSGECAWFDFAKEIAARVNPACDVQPCTTADFPRPAKRPSYSVLSLERTEAEIGTMPDWRDNLASVLQRLE